MSLDGFDVADRDWFETVYGDVTSALGEGARGIVLPDEGDELLVADYAAIEARVLFWLCDDQSALDIFRRREDIYLEMAGAIYGRVPVKGEEVYDDWRFMGKQSVLGLGYGMGPKKFIAHVLQLSGRRIPFKFARDVVRIYRKEKFPTVPLYWNAVEEAAIGTMETGQNRVVQFGNGPTVTYRIADFGDFLQCELPSGRSLWYRSPKLTPMVNYFFKAYDPEADLNAKGKHDVQSLLIAMEARVARDASARELAQRKARSEGLILLPDTPGTKETSKLTYFEANDDGSGVMERVDTYGGKLTENIDQGVSRDLLANSILQLRKRKDLVRRVMMTVHDEVVASAPILPRVLNDDFEFLADARLKEFNKVMELLPEWGAGCPVASEPWRGPRYRKG